MAEENTNIYYPYDEMKTTLIPVAEGCPYNRCSFCAMYKGCDYREVPQAEIDQILLNADEYTERVFLTGADPLAVGYDKIMRILGKIKKLSRIVRVCRHMLLSVPFHDTRKNSCKCCTEKESVCCI